MNHTPNALEEILDAKPDLIPPPDGLWESIYATWTGLWTDWHGEWDERQASDIFPISDLLSSEREQWLKAALEKLINDTVIAELENLPLDDLKDQCFIAFAKRRDARIAELRTHGASK